MAVMFIVMLS